MNNNNNRGSELKNKIAGKVASSIGGPLAGKATEKLGKRNGNSDLISNANKQQSNNTDSQDEALDKEKLDNKDNGESIKDKLSSLTSKNGAAASGDTTAKNSGGASKILSNYLNKKFGFFTSLKIKIIIGVVCVVLFLIIALAIPIVVATVGGTVVEFFTDIGDHIVGFVEKQDQKQMEKYYDKLEKVKIKQFKNKHVCIDENLLTATLTVNLDALDFKKQQNSKTEPIGENKVGYDNQSVVAEGQEDSLKGDGEDAYEGADSVFDNSDEEDEELEFDTDKEKADFKKMRKEIELLSNMQIKTKRYGYDDKLGGLLGRNCWPEGENPEKYEELDPDGTASKDTEDYLVRAENMYRFNPKGLNWLAYFNVNGGFDSSSPELVAKHDKRAFAAFFAKEAKEETNYEFYIHSPRYKTVCEDDNDSSTCKQVCNNKLPKNEYELSIGDLTTMEDSVYYWNLVNSFIPNYYDEYLPDGAGRDEAIKKIAEEIYLLYADLGPGTSCYAYEDQDIICRDDEGPDFYSGDDSKPGFGSTSEFFAKIAPIAIEEMSRTGLNASVIMAQAALESSWGKSGLSTKYANYYGMTSGCIDYSKYPPSQYRGKIVSKDQEFNSCSGNAYWNGSVVAMCNKSGGDCQWYRVYDSFENSTRDHDRLLMESSRYSGCSQYRSPQDQIQCIKNGGYATDPNYVSKIMNVINTYNLSQYDIGEWDGEYTDATTPTYRDTICIERGDGSQVSGDWANWKQFNEPWASMTVHGTSTQFKGFGCYITSLAILIARSGASVSLPNFDPGVLFKYLDGQGVIGKGGYCNSIAPVSSIVPFNIIAYGVSYSPAAIQGYLNQGYYVQVKLQRGDATHFVAVDHVQGNTVYINDPGSSKRTTIADYNGIKTPTSINVYKIG